MRNAILFQLLVCLTMAHAGEYTGRYVYTEPNPEDPGSLVVTLAANAPRPVLAIAIGQRSHNPYRGEIKGDCVITFPHLPIDKYDLVLITGDFVYEGIRLTMLPGHTEPTPADLKAIEEEVRKIEGFFDRKTLHRIEIQGEDAAVFLQQWREKIALKQSGAKVPGSIHSLDIIRFKKPVEGWQLVERRQIYRDELPEARPLDHTFVESLSGIRVINSPKNIGPLSLTPTSTEAP